MILSRTRQKIKFKLQKKLYELGGMHDFLKIEEKNYLESMMGFSGQFEEHRRFQLAFLKSKGLTPQHKLLEIGCGPLTAGLPLIDFLESGNYSGVDIRSNVISEAYNQIGKAQLGHKNPTIIRSDNFGFEKFGKHKFDYILAFSILYHLDDKIVTALFQGISKVMTKGTLFYANTNSISDESTWLEFPFLKRNVDFYENLATQNKLQMKDLGQLKDLDFRLDGEEKFNCQLEFYPQN